MSDPRRGPRAPDAYAFAALISSLSARLAAASGDAVDREVEGGLRELLAFFHVDQCGVLEVQADIRQARLRHVAHVPDFLPAATTLEYGSVCPWTHEKTVIRGESFVQRSIDDLPADAAVDRASCAAMGLNCLVSIPVGIAGRVTHVLCLTSRRAIMDWPEPVLSMLKTIAETFLAVLTRHHAELALQGSLQNLAEARRVAGVGTFVCDWRDDTVTGSDVASRIFGAELGGTARDVLVHVHAHDRARVHDALAESLAAPGKTLDLEYRIVRSDKVIRTIRSSMQSTLTPAGTPLRTVVTILDVSDLRAAEQEAQQLRAQLRHADRVAHLGTLTASLSHELNQPLTGILANAQAALQKLEGGALDHDEARQILEAIVRDDKRAAGVIANLRALLRREETPRSHFDLAEALEDVLALFRSELDAHEVSVDARLAPTSIVFGDRTQVQQIFVNLIANAIAALERVPAGARHLEFSLSRRQQRAVVVVRDSGYGIVADPLARVFEPFYTTRQDGLGMGLPIARSIVEAHGGEIRVSNRARGGAAFTVHLPGTRVARPAPRRLSATRPEVTTRPHGEARVCIVDDDTASREGIARLLTAAGWDVATFASAPAALDSDALRAAHCVILDVQMPDMSGLELHRELVRTGVTAPTIFLSARADADTGVDAMKRGAVEYLTKPVDERALVAAVRQAVDLHDEHLQHAREREELGRRVVRLTPRERAVMRLVVAGRLNKQIAAELAISEATVKQHRGRVMSKMQVRSLADLVRVCETAGFRAGD
ncbi:MAG: response regulator [Burkholderiales bacterium]|nr:response regulator [Burkholderiales bacterium]